MSKDFRQTGKARRDKAVTMAMKRKEEYLGARVPKELRDKVIEYAKERGIPVSILIRNILEDAFGTDSEGRGDTSSSEPKADSEKFTSVLGWERIQLNKAVSCSGCGVSLQQGAEVYLGLGAAEPVVICNTCKERV